MIDNIQKLSQKISKEYNITGMDYSQYNDPVDIIIDAYNNASNLFDSDSDNSIATTTLKFYMEHVDEALENYTKDMDNFKAASSLLIFFIKVQKLLNRGSEALEKKFSSELINNRNYYALFSLDYFLELARSEGIGAALAELEEDVNIRANTYYNAAYKEYLDILPGFEEVISEYSDKSQA